MNLIASLAVASAAYGTSTPQLVGHWTGNGDTVDVVSGRPAKAMGGVTYEPGPTGKAFDFDGENSVVVIPDSPKYQFPDGLTISCWVKPISWPKYGSSPQAPIVFRGDDRSGLDPYVLSLTSDRNWKFLMNDAANNSFEVKSPAEINVWTHLCATWDGATGKMILYVNGVKAAQAQSGLKPLQALDMHYHPGVSFGNVQNPFGDNHYQPYNGSIADIKIYNGALANSDFPARH